MWFLRSSRLTTPLVRHSHTLIPPTGDTPSILGHLKADKIAPASSYISWDTRTPVKLRFDPEGVSPHNYPPILVQSVFENSAAKYPEQVAVGYKNEGKWVKWRYGEYLEDIKAAAAGFLALGLGRYSAVGIMGHNNPLWAISSVGAIFAGGLTCGIYATNSNEAVRHIAANAPCEILVLQDNDLLQRILEGNSNFKESLPTIKAIVLMEGKSNIPNVLSFEELLSLGRGQTSTIIADSLRDQPPVVNEAAGLIYTSGTTGPPKGAMISHDNIVFASISAMMTYQWEREIIMSYLPLSHVAPLIVDVYVSASVGSTTYYADKNVMKGALVDNLREIRPTRLNSVPRVWERIHEGIESKMVESKGLKKALVQWALATGKAHSAGIRAGKTGESLSYKIARKLVLGKVLDQLGISQLAENNGAYVAAAPLSPATFEFMSSLGVNLIDLLGSSETCGPQTTNTPGLGIRPGTVGRSYYGIDNKLLDQDENGVGELITKSRNVFMGYAGQEAKTKEAFTEDFWYRSGDLAKISSDGFVTLQGRQKELIITSGGENIAPTPIENRLLKEMAAFANVAVVAGEQRKYLTCLITLKVVPNAMGQPTNQLDQTVKLWCNNLGYEGKIETPKDFVEAYEKCPKMQSAVQSYLDNVNAQAISNPAKVQKVRFLPHSFTIEGGELGPTLKLKRFVIYDKYGDIIDKMYDC